MTARVEIVGAELLKRALLRHALLLGGARPLWKLVGRGARAVYLGRDGVGVRGDGEGQ